jgi:hypothetical protein
MQFYHFSSEIIKYNNQNANQLFIFALINLK